MGGLEGPADDRDVIPSGVSDVVHLTEEPDMDSVERDMLGCGGALPAA